MQIEHVAGERFATWGPPQQKRDFAVRRGVLRQVVVDTQRVAAAVTEELSNRTSGVRSDVLHRRRIRSGSSNHDRVSHGAVLFKSPDDLCHRGSLLPDGNVDTDNVLASLVDDRVESE